MPKIGHQGESVAFDLSADLTNAHVTPITIIVIVFTAVGTGTTNEGSSFGGNCGRKGLWPVARHGKTG
jgi:hypothetical protein